MAVDIGTGVIRIEIDRAQLRREAAQTSRFLARQRSELRPDINNLRLRNQLRRALSLAGGRQAWRPIERGGEQAMAAVGRRGVAAMQQIEARGTAAAARLQRAFAGVGLAQGGGAIQAAGAALGARGGGGGVARAGGGFLRAVGGGAGFGQNALNIAATTSLANNLPGPLSGIAQKAATAAAANPLAAAAVVAAAVGAGIVTSRFRSAGGFGSGAPGGAFLEAIGFRSAGRISAEGRFDTQASAIQELAGTTDALSRARNRAARETDKSATQEQKARGEYERSRRRTIQARQDEIRDLRRRLRTARFQRRGADIANRLGLNTSRLAGGGLRGFFASSGLASWWGRNFREPDLQFGIDENRRQLANARQQLRDTEFGGSRIRQFLGLRQTLVTPPSAREVEQQGERLRLLNEQQIDAVADQADEYRRSTDLLRRSYRGDRLQRAELRRQRREYISVLRQRAIAERAAAIRERAVTSGFGVDAGLIFGRSGLGLGGRISAFSESITNMAQRLAGWAVGVGIVVGATYALARATFAAVRRSEQVAAAQVAAGSIAQRTLGAPSGAAVDIGAVTAGIRAGADEGLSDLQVYRTAIDAIRTGSSDIFLNTEQVLTDLRVVAAATGVAFEDASTRFFRGIIKREQELLDELGIVARVEAANERYARSINVAASQLTPYQQQLAFANEVQRQLTVSAQNFGTEAVRATQQATIQADKLGARWSNLISDIGADPATRAIAAAGISLATGLEVAVRWLFSIERQQEVQVQQTSDLNRLETDRNRTISERLGLVSKATIQGNLDVTQQRLLVQLLTDVADQRERVFGGGLGTLGFNQDVIRGAVANQTELEGIRRNLADARSRGRISQLQAPAIPLLTAIEPFGFALERIPDSLRLSAEAIERLTANTEEATFARVALAALYGLEVEEIEKIIAASERLADARAKEEKSIQDILRSTNEALRFGPALRQELADLAEAFTTPVLRFRELIPSLDEAIPPPDFMTLPQRNAPFFEESPIELSALDQFSLAAGEIGLTLDTMSSNFSRFAEDLLFESNSIRDALQAFIRNIAQTVVRSGAQSLGNELFGSLGFTNVGGGGGSTYNTINNIGIANPLQAREARFQAAALEGIGL